MAGGNPQISIIIPSYNCAQYLPRVVASAYRLQGCTVEVLVVDDGSTDETPQVCVELQQAYPSLQVIRQVNGGLSSARNHGMDHASGQYLVFLDADDELIPFDALPDLDGRVQMLRIGVEEITLSGEVRLHVEAAEPCAGVEALSRSFAAKDFYTPSCAYIYRTDWVRAKRLRFAPGLIHEDMLFTVEALLACDAYAATKNLVYRYFRRDGSITTAVDNRKLQRRVQSLRDICGRLTVHANRHPEVDIGWWIIHTMDYATSIARQSKRRSEKWRVLLMEVDFHLAYGLWGKYRTWGQVRYRLRMRFTDWLVNR